MALLPPLRSWALAMLLLGACAMAPGPRPEAPQPPGLVPAAAEAGPTVLRRTLANGLRVLLLPDPASPLVCVQLWVGVGSVDEREGVDGRHGITGLSHFFEHLMFQGTARYPNYDEALQPLGARNNAFTYQDATAYWVWAPRTHLPQLLDMEADRFANLKVDFLHLEPEREVVKNERRLRVDADPAEIASEQAVRYAFDSFSYRWGPIGWMSDLDAITLEEAQAYHARHYHPDNATLILSGGFTEAEADRLLAETWGRLAARPRPERPALPPAETWQGQRSAHLLREAPATSLFLAWRAPAPSSADFAALELIDHALTAGKSGRVNQALVLGAGEAGPVASDVSAYLTPLRHPYVWLWRVDLVDGQPATAAISAIEQALSDIARDGLPDEVRARALATLRADMVSANLSHKDLAETVGFSLASTGDPLGFHARLASLATVSQADLQRVAAGLLSGPRVRLTLVPWQRVRALGEVLLALDPPSSALGEMLDEALALLVTEADLGLRQADLDGEGRAITLLAERGAAAMTAAVDEATRAAIRAHLDAAEIGTFKRRAILEAKREKLTAEVRALGEARTALGGRLAAWRRRSRTRGLAAAEAIEAVVRPTTPELANPRRAADVVTGLLTALRHDLAGQHATAQRQREGLAAWLAAEANAPSPTAEATAARVTLRTLLDDLHVSGLPLKDGTP
jgi:zinc protease